MKSNLLEKLEKVLGDTPEPILKQKWNKVLSKKLKGPSAKDFIDSINQTRL